MMPADLHLRRQKPPDEQLISFEEHPGVSVLQRRAGIAQAPSGCRGKDYALKEPPGHVAIT